MGLAGCMILDRSYALEATPTVTPAKAGVQKSQCESIGTMVNDLGHWIPAFAGMTVSTAQLLSAFARGTNYGCLMLTPPSMAQVWPVT